MFKKQSIVWKLICKLISGKIPKESNLVFYDTQLHPDPSCWNHSLVDTLKMSKAEHLTAL